MNELYLRTILILTVLFSGLVGFAQNDSLGKDDFFYPVDIMPQFPGGEIEMYKFTRVDRCIRNQHWLVKSKVG